MNKKHLVVICGQYYPSMSPTGRCAERYALLFSDEYDIDFISESQDGLVQRVEMANGITSYTVSCRRVTLEKQAKGAIRKVIHSLGTLLLFTNYLGNQRWYKKAALRQLEIIHKEKPIDVVWCICSPMAAICVGADFKKNHPEVRVCSYTVDPYSTPDRVRPILHSRKAMLDFEKNTLIRMDSVLLSEEVYNAREELREAIPACRPLPYLMPPFEVSKNIPKRDKVLVGVYAGSFYEKIRNPRYMLKVLSKLNRNTFKLVLYCKGCENVLGEYSNVDNIEQHGLITPTQLAEEYRKADILIGVGNSVSEFLPSKTFEYIAQGKPIVYFNYKGHNSQELEIYPLALQLSDEMPVETACASLLEFCERVKTETVREEDLAAIYTKHSPSNIKQIIKEAFI
ncbi:glycosyltransferase [uncultured Prevotella sp.]|uniref:glycosyltransferase n=1 Tax=uncultured Prevotella sp. TaxID=159272 RepID=UPI00258729CF|nr:glycosyltransferase [uncultured Prevotella sp.]